MLQARHACDKTKIGRESSCSSGGFAFSKATKRNSLRTAAAENEQSEITGLRDYRTQYESNEQARTANAPALPEYTTAYGLVTLRSSFAATEEYAYKIRYILFTAHNRTKHAWRV